MRLERDEILLEDIYSEDFKEGWESARENFGYEIHFHAPSIKSYETTGFKNSSIPRFIPVSITGGSCRLKCEHCRAKILQTMHRARTPADLLQLGQRLREQGGEGMLISGGSLEDGTVPLLPFIDAIAGLKDMGFAIAVHTGLVDEELARGLAAAGTDVAMLDIIGSGETIREVYHLDATTADFEASLKLLCDSGVRTAPHVVIGLHFGRIKGEREALAMVSRYPVSSLVLVILTSQLGTPMQDVAPPGHLEIGGIFTAARSMLPTTPVMLGCARPYGEHKVKTDIMALRAGLNGIAYPAEGIVEHARDLGLKPVFSEQCCSLMG